MKRSIVSSVYSLREKRKKEIGILIDKPWSEKPETVRTPENIADVAESVCEVPLAGARMPSSRDHEEAVCQLEYSKTSIVLVVATLTIIRNFTLFACNPFHPSLYCARIINQFSSVGYYCIRLRESVEVGEEDDLASVGKTKSRKPCHRL